MMTATDVVKVGFELNDFMRQRFLRRWRLFAALVLARHAGLDCFCSSRSVACLRGTTVLYSGLLLPDRSCGTKFMHKYARMRSTVSTINKSESLLLVSSAGKVTKNVDQRWGPVKTLCKCLQARASPFETVRSTGWPKEFYRRAGPKIKCACLYQITLIWCKIPSKTIQMLWRSMTWFDAMAVTSFVQLRGIHSTHSAWF